MEIVRCTRTATLPAVFRLDDHLKRMPADAGDILQALETHQEAWVTLDAGQFRVWSYPPPSPGAALFLAKNGVLYAVRGKDSVIRDTIVRLMGAFECETPFEADEAFEADPVHGIRPLKEGPLTRKAQELYRRASRGELPGYEHWITYVGRIFV